MSEANHELALPGCSTSCLAHYLKALAVLRLLGEQVDAQARGRWDNGLFHISSRLDVDALLRFFLHDYRPTALVAPWNGGSGFHPKDTQPAIDALGETDAPRLTHYAQMVAACRTIVREVAPDGPPAKGAKEAMLLLCRSRLADTALAWLDAAYALTAGGPSYPPLLGTGGNDGRLEFTSNFMQRVLAVMDAETGAPTSDSERWLLDALLAVATPRPSGKGTATGQFVPGAAGGPNASAGFEGESLCNPWDFILGLEGAVLFAGSVTRRLGAGGRQSTSYPFTVGTADVGYASAAEADRSRDNSRGEIWLPLWGRPATHVEVEALFSEGRVGVGRRRARDGVDFARAVSSLGVDRGIAAFERFALLKRNGRSFLAMPLERWSLPRRPANEMSLLAQIDDWIATVERAAAKEITPAGIRAAFRSTKAAMMAVCRDPHTPVAWQELLCALGAAEAAMVHSPKTAVGARLAPLPPLGLGWLDACDDGSREFRLALALASIRDAHVGPIRANMAPVIWEGGHPRFRAKRMDDPSVVWRRADLCGNMTAVLLRRCTEASMRNLDALPLAGIRPARLGDIGAFVYGALDEGKLEALLWGLNAVDLGRRPAGVERDPARAALPAAYCILKLAHLPRPLSRGRGEDAIAIRRDPEITRLACAGRLTEAVAAAAHRLRASGLSPAFSSLAEAEALAPRIAAALLFPVSEHATLELGDRVLLPTSE